MKAGWLAVLAAGLVGWLSADEAGAGAKPKATFDKIVLTSSGGFTGRGSGKALTVTGQGKFTAKDREAARDGVLQPDELARLQKLVAAVDWKQVKTSYQGQGADFFQDDLTITVGGKTFETHITEDVDRKSLPPALRELLAYLNALHARYKPAGGADK
jgi:hypothetical protein